MVYFFILRKKKPVTPQQSTLIVKNKLQIDNLNQTIDNYSLYLLIQNKYIYINNLKPIHS